MKCQVCNGTGLAILKFPVNYNRFAMMKGRQKMVSITIPCSYCGGTGIRKRNETMQMSKRL